MLRRVALEEVKAGLIAKQRDLSVGLVSHEAIAVVSTADEMDGVKLAVEREQATADLERKYRLARQIADALERMELGAYGSCIRCGAEIAPARLVSVPWTAHCLQCQEAAEQRHAGNG